ncbi:MAG: DUF1045 domain-containing protein [Aquisalimonadaceae bacterium]
MAARYALYLAPAPETALSRLASAWLGRDAVNDAALPHPNAAGLSAAEIDAITARPRRYGFHATLKAPFTLAEGTTETELRTRLDAFVRSRRSFNVALQVGRVDRFLALIPREPTPDLDDLAAACVETFDPFRAPPGRDVVARRLENGLTSREREMLERWGYPYVMDQFRFHMTLTTTLPDPDLDRVLPSLRTLFDSVLLRPTTVDAVALFVQRDPESNFLLQERFRFGI